MPRHLNALPVSARSAQASVSAPQRARPRPRLCFSARRRGERADIPEKEGSVVNPIQLQKYLQGVNYPARKDDLLSAAEKNDAPEDVVEEIRSLSGDEFDGPDQVMKAFGR